jgi:hypothetical protein
MQIENYLIEFQPGALIPPLFGAAVTIPSFIAIVRIIQRAGFSGRWILIAFVPGINVLALWYFGFGPWPALKLKGP